VFVPGRPLSLVEFLQVGLGAYPRVEHLKGAYFRVEYLKGAFPIIIALEKSLV
jgi:hypothetical protein